jgi:hypothetical protein
MSFILFSRRNNIRDAVSFHQLYEPSDKTGNIEPFKLLSDGSDLGIQTTPDIGSEVKELHNSVKSFCV